MKKLMMAIIITAAFSGAVFGQTTYEFGLKVGGGAASINIDGVDPKPGFDGGIFFGIKTSPKLTIQPELLLTQKGMEIGLLGLASYSWNFSYIEVPVLAKFYFTSDGDFRPLIFGGPYMAFLSSAKARWEVVLLGDEENDIKDAFKSTELGICGGLGLDWAISDNGKLVMDFRVAVSLSDILDDRDVLVEEEGITIGTGSMRHVNAFFTVGYAFNFGGGI